MQVSDTNTFEIGMSNFFQDFHVFEKSLEDHTPYPLDMQWTKMLDIGTSRKMESQSNIAGLLFLSA